MRIMKEKKNSDWRNKPLLKNKTLTNVGISYCYIDVIFWE